MQKSKITLRLTFESSKELYEYEKQLEEFKDWRKDILYRKKVEIIENITIDSLCLSIRSQNCLKVFKAVGDIINLTEGELLYQPNFGRKSLREIRECIYGDEDSRWGRPFTEEDFKRFAESFWNVRDEFNKIDK